MKLRFGLAALLAGGGCADQTFDVDRSEVINGQLTTAGKFPGVGALMYDFGGGGPPEFGCTGTLIAPNAVLTAAHCLFGAPSAPGFTLALDTSTNPEVVPGLTAIPHEMFDFDDPGMGLNEFFDIGVLILAEPVTSVEPVPMARPVDSANLVATLAMEIAGYGETEEGGGGVMHDATTALISLNPTEIQVGMGLPQAQNCYGDSGGPGFANLGGVRRLIGVVSRSFAGEECTMGGVDTRVDAYLSWIHSNVTDVPCDSGMSPACEPPPPPPDPDPDPTEAEDGGGCCSTSGSGVPSLALAFAVGALLFRRRRSR